MSSQTLQFTTAISACLVGIPCRWNAHDKSNAEAIAAFSQGDTLVVCPEVLGGLTTPRPACEIVGGDGRDVLAGTARVMDADGNDYTQQFVRGAERAVSLLVQHGISKIILKSGSPSCGAGTIYDGHFSGKTTEGIGVFTALLQKHNISIITEL